MRENNRNCPSGLERDTLNQLLSFHSVLAFAVRFAWGLCAFDNEGNYSRDDVPGSLSMCPGYLRTDRGWKINLVRSDRRIHARTSVIRCSIVKASKDR